MTKRRLAIQDDQGQHLMAAYVDQAAVGFEGADLSCLQASGVTNLRGQSFRGASLYWANLEHADFSDCDFEGANLAGATLCNGLFVRANFRGARLGLDNLAGPTRLQGADFTGADFTRADLKGAEYDSATHLPTGFDADQAGMVCTDAG